jgi:hypothetical protein
VEVPYIQFMHRDGIEEPEYPSHVEAEQQFFCESAVFRIKFGKITWKEKVVPCNESEIGYTLPFPPGVKNDRSEDYDIVVALMVVCRYDSSVIGKHARAVRTYSVLAAADQEKY